MDKSFLNTITLTCMDGYRDDVNSRAPWEDRLAKGLALLGMEVERRSDPWPEACGVFHPMLLESVVRGWAKSMKALTPAGGPAKDKIKGTITPERMKQAKRVKDEMNNIIIFDIPD